MKEMLINHINVTYGAIGLSGFWTTFQDNIKYVIFAATIFFAIREWKSKAIGKMVTVIIIGALLAVLTVNPETVLKPLGEKIFEMIGA